MGDLRDPWAVECTHRVLDASLSASPRIAVASLGMVAWASSLYASSVGLLVDGGGGERHPIAVACTAAAAAYPCIVVLMGVARNSARGWCMGATRDLEAFLGVQRSIDEAYVVTWDAVGILLRAVLTLGLCVYGYEGWPRG